MTKVTVIGADALPFPDLRLLDRRDPESGLESFVVGANASVRFSIGGEVFPLIIKAGYETDLAGVPRWLHALYESDDPRTALAGLVHDALYESCGGLISVLRIAPVGPRPLSREECDAALAAFMAAAGCSWLRRRLYYVSVRLFGGAVWNSHLPGGGSGPSEKIIPG